MFQKIIVPTFTLTRLVRQVFPLVDKELRYWHNYAERHLGPELAAQAISSIEKKRFHCLGGSVYSLYPGVNTTGFVRFVVALQTISDYLDNLCDRTCLADEVAFAQLHLAMTDAVNPYAPLKNYYSHYPFKQDTSYLATLVATCQQELQKLPSYPLVREEVSKLARLYSQLQTYKHLAIAEREQKLAAWNECYMSIYPELTTHEFAAATGSTLGIFILCALASKPYLSSDEIQLTLSAYFPWICGLHILLDYFIDQQEDLATGDLNFVAYYQEAEIGDRLTFFADQSYLYVQNLSEIFFNQTIIDGLLALYLSDPKTNRGLEKKIRRQLIHSAHFSAKIAYGLCLWLRKKNKL